MRMILYELTGWALTLFGICLIVLIYFWVLDRQIFGAMALSLPSLIVFRAGIGLIRLAIAARMAKSLSSDR